jgi:hypothetical protein
MAMMTLDYIIIFTVELVLKNSYRTYPYSYVMVMMISDYIINVAVELASKNDYRTYPYHVLW